MKTTNSAGISLIKASEGCVLSAYCHQGDVPTIGYGHTSGVKMGQTITQAQAEAYLKQDLAIFERGVSNLLKVQVTDNQFAALVSFAYNLGIGALQGSTLLRLLNQGNYSGAADQFGRWVYAAGRQLPGLVTRRAAERKLFLTK